MLKVEVAHRPGRNWIELPSLRPGMPPGSMSHNTQVGRTLILFYCLEKHSVIGQARAGTESLVGYIGREILPEHVEIMAFLTPGDSYEMEITTDDGISATARWTHIA